MQGSSSAQADEEAAIASRGRSRSPRLRETCASQTLRLVATSSLSGDVVGEVKAESLQRIDEVKRAFVASAGTPARYIRLTIGGRELSDSRTLLEEGLVELVAADGFVHIGLVRSAVEQPSLLAVPEDDPMLVPFLVKCGADPNETDDTGWTALHWAAHHNHTSVAAAVLACSEFAATDAQDIGRHTALDSFAQKGHAEMCRLLATRSDFTQLNARGCNGNTPLHWAARSGHAAVCEALLELEGFIALNEQNVYGWTALHYTAANGLKQASELIISHPRFNAIAETTNNGETALHWAALNGHIDICRALLRDGHLDANVADVEGLSAMDGAKRHGHKAVCELLAC